LLFVAANPSIDRLYEVDALAIGSIHRPLAEVAVPGGKGLNAARAAATLGGSVTVVGIVAGRAGEWIVDGLATLGIEARMARGTGETRTCVSILDRADGRLTEVYPRGPEVESATWAAFESVVRTELAHDVAVSGALGSLPARCAVRRVRAHRPNGGGPGARGARSSQTQPAMRSSRVLEERPALVKVNAGEAGRCHERRRDGRVVRGRRSNMLCRRDGAGVADRDPGSERRGRS
jgi:fructose-1-phosphate kinase PfkB-like protein